MDQNTTHLQYLVALSQIDNHSFGRRRVIVDQVLIELWNSSPRAWIYLSNREIGTWSGLPRWTASKLIKRLVDDRVLECRAGAGSRRSAYRFNSDLSQWRVSWRVPFAEVAWKVRSAAFELAEPSEPFAPSRTTAQRPIFDVTGDGTSTNLRRHPRRRGDVTGDGTATSPVTSQISGGDVTDDGRNTPLATSPVTAQTNGEHTFIPYIGINSSSSSSTQRDERQEEEEDFKLLKKAIHDATGKPIFGKYDVIARESLRRNGLDACLRAVSAGSATLGLAGQMAALEQLDPETDGRRASERTKCPRCGAIDPGPGHDLFCD